MSNWSERKYIFAPLIAAILVLPLLVALGCQFDDSKPIRIVVPFSTLLLQAFCIFGRSKDAEGLVRCGVGVPWELHTAFAVLVAVYAFSRLAEAMVHNKKYFQEKAKGKMCGCCPPLPYCGFRALVKIEFYVVDTCMERPYSCHWEWANVSAMVLVIATSTAWHGVVLEDLVHGGVANCVQPTGEKRPFPFSFGLKKLHEVIKFFCRGMKGYSAWLIDMIMVTGCHRNNSQKGR